MTQPASILLVEDQPIARLALHTVIYTLPDMEIVAETGCGEKAQALFQQHKPDVTIMDLRLPGCTNKEIGDLLAIAKNTVRIHTSSILDELGASDRTQAVLAGILREPVHSHLRG